MCDIRYLNETPPCYFQNWFIAIALIALFPAGLILVWKKPVWSVKLKSVITSAALIVLAGLMVSSYQISIALTRLSIQLDAEQGSAFDTGLTIEVNIKGTPEQASLLGLIYYSDDNTVAVFEKGRVFTVGEGKTEIYVSDKGKSVFSNKITIKVTDKEAEWAALEAGRSKQAEEITDYINNLGEITFESAEAISLAREAYDNADKYVKQMVPNLFTLEQAEQEYQLILETYEFEPTEDDFYMMVYYTQTGSKYHFNNSCGSGTYYPCTLGEAYEMELGPCGKCVNYKNYMKLRSEQD